MNGRQLRIDRCAIMVGLYPDADLDYMEHRILEETSGDHGIEVLRT